MTAVYILIYLSGYVASYLLARWSIKTLFHEWLRSDRYAALAYAIFSWVGFLCIAIAHYSWRDNKKPYKKGTPAKW